MDWRKSFMPKIGELISFLFKSTGKWILVFLFFLPDCVAKEIIMNVGYANQRGIAPPNKFQSIKVAQDDKLILMISVLFDEKDISWDFSKISNYNFLEMSGLKNFNIGTPNLSRGFYHKDGKAFPCFNHNFFFEPTKEGKFKIGPARCLIDDEIFESDPVEVVVIKSENHKDFFVTLLADEEKRLFLGQKTTLTLKLFLNQEKFDSLERAHVVKPDLNDFEIVDLPEKTKDYIENLGGRNYRVIEMAYSVLPLKSGTLEVLPFKVAYEISKRRVSQTNVFGFFASFISCDIIPGTLHSNDGMPISIEVEKVPDNVSAVGSFFKTDLRLEREKTKVGQPIILTFEILGSGDCDKILHPELVLPEQLRVYDSKSDDLKVGKNETKDGITFRKRFEYIIQAPKPGIYQIPEQEFVYFDTVSESVVTIKTKPLTLTAVADQSEETGEKLQKFDVSSQNQADSITSVEEKKLIEKLKFIGISNEYQKPIELKQWKLFFPLLLILLFSLIAFFWAEIRAWFLAKNKSRWAKIRAARELSSAFKKDQLRVIYSVFIRYFSTRFSVQIEAIDADWMLLKLKKIGLERSKIDDFFVFFDEVASLAFGKELHKYGHMESDALFKKSLFWLEVVDGLFVKHEAQGKNE